MLVYSSSLCLHPSMCLSLSSFVIIYLSFAHLSSISGLFLLLPHLLHTFSPVSHYTILTESSTPHLTHPSFAHFHFFLFTLTFHSIHVLTFFIIHLLLPITSALTPYPHLILPKQAARRNNQAFTSLALSTNYYQVSGNRRVDVRRLVMSHHNTAPHKSPWLNPCCLGLIVASLTWGHSWGAPSGLDGARGGR